jgi:predicted Zn finger-like uncharacterized protein
MNIICKNCKGKFRIADEKIPAGKTASFPCPKCKETIYVSGETEEKNIKGPVDEGLDFYETDEYDYKSDEKTFDFVEEEGDTALICEEDPAIKKKISDVLNLMEYHFTEAENSRDALTRLRYHSYDLVITNERFDTSNPDANTVLTFLERRSMADRRNTCLILISSRFRTMDNMMALQKSVNYIINIKDINNIDKIIGRVVADNEFFFRAYNETLKSAGKI